MNQKVAETEEEKVEILGKVEKKLKIAVLEVRCCQ